MLRDERRKIFAGCAWRRRFTETLVARSGLIQLLRKLSRCRMDVCSTTDSWRSRQHLGAHDVALLAKLFPAL